MAKTTTLGPLGLPSQIYGFQEGPLPTPGSFTADAVIFSAPAGSITANAYIVYRYSGTFTADANINKHGFVLGDAVLFKADNAGSIAADAAIQKEVSGSVTGDAYIIYRISGSVSGDAVVWKSAPGSITADARIVDTGESIVLASAVIQDTISGSVTADAYLLVPSTEAGSITGDAAVQKTVASSIAGDAVVQATQASSFFADAYIKADFAIYSSFTANAWIVESGGTPTPRFQIEGLSPPNPRGSPKGGGYSLHYPDPKGEDGNRRAVGAVGYPWMEIVFEYVEYDVLDWYLQWFSAGDAWANIDDVQCFDPYADGGAQWVLFNGSDIRIWYPTIGGIRGWYAYNVRIIITNLYYA